MRLSKEHGVNPSLMNCFWCGESFGVALLGANHGKKAPHSIVVDYEPCGDCQEIRKKGLTLLEATDAPNHEGQPDMQKGVYPTGRWWVVDPKLGKAMFDTDVPVACIEVALAKQIGLYDVQETDGE